MSDTGSENEEIEKKTYGLRKENAGIFHFKRTTHRSSKGTKLYAVRDSKRRFKDIQTYKRAHAMDIKRGSKSEAIATAK